MPSFPSSTWPSAPGATSSGRSTRTWSRRVSERCPSKAAIASSDIPRLIAWVARVWRSWWGETCPIFTVSEKVEALYEAPKQLPADAEGAEMRKLRAEMHRRMLGNGYCARPVGMDCHFESICESCTFFQTTIEFRPTLQKQRDDAATKAQVGRQKIFDGLLARLDEDAS